MAALISKGFPSSPEGAAATIFMGFPISGERAAVPISKELLGVHNRPVVNPYRTQYNCTYRSGYMDTGSALYPGIVRIPGPLQLMASNVHPAGTAGSGLWTYPFWPLSYRYRTREYFKTHGALSITYAQFIFLFI